MVESRNTIGMLLIGMAVGLYLPPFPAPLDSFRNVYLGLLLIVIAIILFIKG